MKIKSVRKQSPGTITVELTEGEADYIFATTVVAGGSAIHSPRKYADRLRAKLGNVLGYDYTQSDAYKLLNKTTRGLQFHNYDKLAVRSDLAKVAEEFDRKPVPLPEGGRRQPAGYQRATSTADVIHQLRQRYGEGEVAKLIDNQVQRVIKDAAAHGKAVHIYLPPTS